MIGKIDGEPVATSAFRDDLLGGGVRRRLPRVRPPPDAVGRVRTAGTRGRRRSAPRARPMPEGDTLFRTAAGLRPYLVGRTVDAARARQPGPQADRLVGATVTGVEAQGKNLLIRFDNGLEVRTHLGMHGSWHRYRPGERWRRPPARARLVLEVPGAVAVCFDAPTVELFEQRAGGAAPEPARSSGRTCSSTRSTSTRRCAACATPRSARRRSARRCSTSGRSRGSATRSGTRPCGRRACRRSVPVEDGGRRDAPRRSSSGRARSSRRAPRTGRRPSDIHGRSGRPCPRCGSLIRSEAYGGELPRIAYWCPTCQPRPREDSTMSETIDVRCEAIQGGAWACVVTIDDGDGAPTRHDVTVTTGDLADLAPDATEPDGPRPPLVRVPPRARAEGLDPAPLRPAADRPLLPGVRARRSAA